MPRTHAPRTRPWQRRVPRRAITWWFPSAPQQSFHIAEEALRNRDKSLHAVDNWHNPVIQLKAYPDWVKQVVLNKLYHSTFGGSFWENGCLAKPKKFGNRPGQHISFVMKCQKDPFAESFDVRHHWARRDRDLWPGHATAFQGFRAVRPRTFITVGNSGVTAHCKANAMLAAWGVYYQTWINEETASCFSTPEAWRIDDPRTFRALMYQRARGAWEFAME